MVEYGCPPLMMAMHEGGTTPMVSGPMEFST